MSNDQKEATYGWVIFIAAIGMLFSMISVDIVALDKWPSISTPAFVGTTIGHIAAVITAFVGGKLIPSNRDPNARDRVTDKTVITMVKE